ncbi:hypothetical protein ACTOB_004345 [Actinoplanes oblitus]|uniref:DUF4185 domain-containing protein n=1 Tax=Actinoplanes oblitus TaxID=3040509 RepID=A0ABY8WRZ4_9ACTN|nr:hypothetical protein [Actinoplanes oblitus]WIN00630.1 hypothetical protein ACTOB_004345 [Actinoplanes oblitus]
MRIRGATVAVLVAGAALTVPGAALADVPPPARVVSRYETASGNTLGRDCGFSAPLPSASGQALWTFCDTAVVNPAGTVIGFIGGSTAAVGSYTAGQVPSTLSELPTPPAAPAVPSNRGPAPFLPTPTGLVLPGTTTACGAADTGSYAASWITGLTRGPNRTISGRSGSSLLFLTYTNVCVYNKAWTTQSYGVTFYDPATNQLVGPATVFPRPATGELAWQRRLGSPTFAADGYLYLYTFLCTSSAYGACGAGTVALARTPWSSSAGWSSGGSYRYWTGSTWSSDSAAATSALPGARPFGIDVRVFPGRGYVAVEQTTIAGHYRVWTAPAPTGPWTAGTEAVLPGCASTTKSWCYAFIGHPELSTTSALFISHFHPDDNHVRVVAVPW